MMRLHGRIQIVLLIGLTGLTACTASRITTTAVEIDGMNNSVDVGDLLIGGQPSVEALSFLADEGYRTIVSIRAEGEIEWDEKAVVDSLGMRFVSIPMPGPVEEITREQVARFDEVLQIGDGPVVLHCGSGNRAAALWAIWLNEEKGLSAEKSIDLAERAGMTRMRSVVERQLGVETKKE